MAERGHNGTNGTNGVAGQMGRMSLNGDRNSRGRGATFRPKTQEEREADSDFVKTRPVTLTSKKGDRGKNINLVTNAFKFKQQDRCLLFKYDIKISPAVDETFTKKRIMKNVEGGLDVTYIFDGTSFYTYNKLSADVNVDVVRSSSLQGNETVFQVVFHYVQQISATDFEYLQVYNIVKNQANEHLELVNFRRDYFDQKASITVQEFKLEIWPGYVTSIRQCENEILLTVDTKSKVLRTDTVWDQINFLSGRNRGNFGQLKMILEKELLGAIVMTKYNRKFYRIDDFDLQTTANRTFEKKDGSKITYADYYKQRYGLTIVNPERQPLLVSMPKEKDIRGGRPETVMLVPSLCYMTGLNDEQRANFKLMERISQFTRPNPNSRVEKLNRFAHRYTTTPNVVSTFANWGLAMIPEMAKIQGRVLDLEAIHHGRGKVMPNDVMEWNAIYRSPMLSGITIQRWVCIYPAAMFENMDKFHKSMVQVARGMGITMQDPKWVEIPDSRTTTYLSEIKKIVGLKPHMIMAVIPTAKADMYTAIKKELCLGSTPVPSQVITDQKVLRKERQHMSMATKVVAQMATKLGAVPWQVSIPLKKAMVVGFDTYHDTADKKKSYGAIVASINPAMTQYTSHVSKHESRQELCDQFYPMMIKCLRKYQEVNNCLPDTIIFYRDGVGEGQVSKVVTHEIEQIERAFSSYTDYNPKFACIIVSKRINQRFFHPSGNQNLNPPAGTVVDDVVTLPERYDFYLISQSVKQGTVNPTSYNIVKNTTNLAPNHFQMLTYKLCHLYYNWPGTVRVPAPCQYAHKLAYLVGESLHDTPSEHFDNILFYL